MKKLCLSLVLASIGSLALTNSAIADEVNEIYNPNPQKDDVVLSMPCDGIMVFRKVYTSNDPKKIKDKKVGIYKDKNKIYAINPICTHLGCLLSWNDLDKTWDCPCHGSRYNFKGESLYDPAFKNLESLNYLL